MNQLFLANPELVDEMKEVIIHESDSGDEGISSPQKNQGFPSPLPSPVKDILGDREATFNLPNEEEKGPKSKFWGAISKEMQKTAKTSKVLNINQINHHLNIYKTAIQKPEPSALWSKSTTPKDGGASQKGFGKNKNAKSGNNKLTRVSSAHPGTLNRGKDIPGGG